MKRIAQLWLQALYPVALVMALLFVLGICIYAALTALTWYHRGGRPGSSKSQAPSSIERTV